MSRYRQTMSEALKQVRGIKEQDDKDHEISMARGELQAIADKATQLSSALQGKSDEGNPLEAWVQSKITKAKDYINSVSDYLMYNPDMKQNEEVNETPQGYALVQKAKEIAKKFANNMSKAVAEIEKLEKGLSKNSSVKDALQKANESLEEKFTVQITKKDGTTMELGRYNTAAEAQRFVDMYGKGAKVKKEELEIDEKISDIFKANKEGESAEDIAKKLKLSPAMVKKLLGEQQEEQPKEEPKKEDSKENKEKEVQTLKNQVALLKQKIENEKNKAIKPEPNPETGEVPLTIGIAHAEFKKKKEEVKEENLQELSKAERDKRIQRAKDMIKYYDAQKKAALKGPNKAIAKKMLKNETELEEGTKPIDFKVKMKTPSGMKMVKVTVPVKDYKVDMAAIEDAARKKIKGDMMDFDFVGDLKMGESLEEVSQKEIDKFHTDLDSLVHKTFGHSSKEKMDEKVADSIIKDLQKAYAPMKGKRISPEMANKISKHLDQKSYDLNVLRQLYKANIPFISTIARNKI